MLTNEAVICLYKLWEVWPLQYKQFNLKEAIFINLSLLLLALLKTVSTDNRWLRCVGLLILLLAGFKNMSRRKKTCISWISPTPLHQCQKEREKKSFSSCVNNKELFKARHPGNKEKKKKKRDCTETHTAMLKAININIWTPSAEYVNNDSPLAGDCCQSLWNVSLCLYAHIWMCRNSEPTSPAYISSSYARLLSSCDWVCDCVCPQGCCLCSWAQG